MPERSPLRAPRGGRDDRRLPPASRPLRPRHGPDRLISGPRRTSRPRFNERCDRRALLPRHHGRPADRAHRRALPRRPDSPSIASSAMSASPTASLRSATAPSGSPALDGRIIATTTTPRPARSPTGASSPTPRRARPRRRHHRRRGYSGTPSGTAGGSSATPLTGASTASSACPSRSRRAACSAAGLHALRHPAVGYHAGTALQAAPGGGLSPSTSASPASPNRFAG